MKKSQFCCMLLACAMLAPRGAGQIDAPRVPVERDVGDLFRRAAASRFVVVGTVVKSQGVTKRMTPEILDKAKVDLGATLGGPLYTIHVEQTICRQTDFRIQPSASSQGPQTVEIFVPRTFAVYPDEALLEGGRYLLFLVVPEEQAQWANQFQLDPKHVYYRAEEGYRGAIPLPQPTAPQPTPKQPPVLEMVTRLCQAIRPPRVADKLKALNKLAASDDPVLRKEAEEAMQFFKAAPHD